MKFKKKLFNCVVIAGWDRMMTSTNKNFFSFAPFLNPRQGRNVTGRIVFSAQTNRSRVQPLSRSRDAGLVRLLHSHRPKPLQQVSGCVFGPLLVRLLHSHRPKPLQGGLGMRVWCTPECNCCMPHGPNEPHHGSTSSSRSRDACLVHTRVQLLHVHRPNEPHQGSTSSSRSRDACLVHTRVRLLHVHRPKRTAPGSTSSSRSRDACLVHTRVQLLHAHRPKRTAPRFNLFSRSRDALFGAPRVQLLHVHRPNEPLQGSTSSSRSRDACLVVHTRVQLLHAHRPKRTAPRFNLFKQVSGRVFWCTPECNCCMFTGPNEPHQGSTSSSRSRDACLVHTRVQLLHVHHGPNEPLQGSTSSSRYRDACLVCFWCDCCILTGPNLFKQVSGPCLVHTQVRLLHVHRPKRTAPGFHLFKEVSGRVFWCTPKCDCCMFTGPIEPLQGSTSSRRSRDACLVRFLVHT